jgi:rare lipoprotein A
MKKHITFSLFTVSTLLFASHHSVAANPYRPAEPSAPKEDVTWVGETGIASYYSAKYHGRITSSGVRFDQTQLTAAHAWLPFGTKVRVTLARTGSSVIVTITDRLYSARRVVDLSRGAAQQLGILQQGVAEVSLAPA